MDLGTNPFVPEYTQSVSNYTDFSPNVFISHSWKLKFGSD